MKIQVFKTTGLQCIFSIYSGILELNYFWGCAFFSMDVIKTIIIVFKFGFVREVANLDLVQRKTMSQLVSLETSSEKLDLMVLINPKTKMQKRQQKCTFLEYPR